MNNDANPFAGYEPNAAAGEDLGGDLNLAGAAGRDARTGSVLGRSDQGAAPAALPPPWPGLGLNPCGPTFRAETQHGVAADRTTPPLPEKEEEGAAEPADPSTELLRKMLAGNCEPDISRVKLVSSDESSRLPQAKAWEDSFNIRLRTWANVISPEFEGQQADLSRHGTADRQLVHEICLNIGDMMSPYLLGANLSSGCAVLSVAQRNPCQRGKAHGSTSREVCQACLLPKQKNKAADAERVADRSRGVACGRKLAIQRNSDAVSEDGHGWHQRPQQRA